MKMKLLMMLLIGQLAFVTKNFSQNIAINGTGSLPDTSAMLDVSSTNKGFLAPRMTTAQQNTIPLPANGLLVYNLTDNLFMVNTGTNVSPLWTPLATGTSGEGTVSSFSAGTLAPLFSTSVASSSTTPALTFNASTAAAYTFLGRASATGAYSFISGMDSNWIPALHTQTYYDLRYNPLLVSGTNIKTVNNTSLMGSGNVSVEAVITAPNTTLRYWTGYKTFGSFYDSARRAISLTTTGTSGAATYNNATGVLNIPAYTGGAGGVTSVGLTSSDITVSGASPITGSGTYTLALPTVNSNVGTYTNATITVNAKGLITAAGSGGSGGSSSGWSLSGNSGTGSGSYVGTSDGQSLTFKVNGTQAGFLGLSGSSYATSFGVGSNASYQSTAIGAGARANSNNEAAALGYNSNAEGYRSIAIGSGARAYAQNEAIAIGAGSSGNGYQGIAIGSGASVSSNNSTLAIGTGANATGYQSTAIGSGSRATAQNSTAIGNGATATNENYISIGNKSVTAIRGQVNFTTYSDGRFKRNIHTDVPGLNFILQLRPVTYNWDIHKFNEHSNGNEIKAVPAGYSERNEQEEAAILKKESIIYTGFIAQEVEKAAQDCKFNFSGVLKPLNDKDAYSLSYAEFVVPLVKATQELNEKNEALMSMLDKQQKMIEHLIEEIEQLKKHK